MKRIVLIKGDGIGPEIADAVLYILDAAGAQIDWDEVVIGPQAFEETGNPLPDDVIAKIRECGIALKGPVTTPVGTGFRSVNVGLRKALDLYANLRPVRTIPGLETRYPAIDIIFVRENTEGLYSGIEHEVVPGVVASLKVATRKACTRIAEFAFSYAERHGRKRVTAIHKANILKLSDGLSIDCYREVADHHPAIEYDERIVDATAMSLALDPTQFDMLLMENLYGDILSDLGAGLVGGLGLTPSANIGTNAAVFEAVHGSAPDIAGKGVANPTALLLSAVEMLRYAGDSERANRIEDAVRKTFQDGKCRTPDLGGTASTMEFARAVSEQLS